MVRAQRRTTERMHQPITPRHSDRREASLDETRSRPPTGARQQISERTEGSGSDESRRRSRRRTRPSPGWRREPAIGTHQEPARRQRQHGQPQGCADHLRLREASDGPRIAIATRSGAGYQGQATTRRCANDDLHRTLTVLMCRSRPRGSRSLNQGRGRHDDDKSACHTEATTETTHPDRNASRDTPRPQPNRAPQPRRRSRALDPMRDRRHAERLPRMITALEVHVGGIHLRPHRSRRRRTRLRLVSVIGGSGRLTDLTMGRRVRLVWAALFAATATAAADATPAILAGLSVHAVD